MQSLVLDAFTRSPFDKVSFHVMGNISSREVAQSLLAYLSQYACGHLLLKSQSDHKFFLLQ